MSNIDISIKQVEKVVRHVKKETIEENKKSYDFFNPISSKLVLEFDGKDVENVLLNTLKRVAYDNVPTYAFPSGLINITENTTIFNNDYMRLRLSNLPIYGTPLDIFYLDPVYWSNINYSDHNRPRHPSEKQIEIAINSYNDTNFIKNITTNDINYYEDGELVNRYHKDAPVLLVQLRPAETFKCTMRAVLGVGEVQNQWAAAGDVYYDDMTTNDITGEIIEKKNDKIVFTIESLGQYDEYDILLKGCNYIIKKLDDIKNDLSKKFSTSQVPTSNQMVIILDGEDHTMGQLLNYYFQNHPDILFSGLTKPDNLINSISFKIVCSKSIKSPVNAIYEQIEYIKKIFLHIEKNIMKLSSKKLSRSRKL